MGWRRGVLGWFRAPDGCGCGPGFFFHDIPITQVLALEANDHPAVKVLEDRRRTSQHPPGGLLDGVALALPADEVAVVDRPGSLDAEDLLELDRLRQWPVEIARPRGLPLERAY
jgi:hypothetical protein